MGCPTKSGIQPLLQTILRALDFNLMFSLSLACLMNRIIMACLFLAFSCVSEASISDTLEQKIFLLERPPLGSSIGFSVPSFRNMPEGDKGIDLYTSGSFRVIRRFPSGYLDVFFRDKKSEVRVNLPLDLRRNSFPLLFLESEDGLYIVSYDVVANLPSGQRHDRVREGLDIYFLPRNDPSKGLKQVAEQIKLGGVDSLLYGAIRGQEMDLCDSARCLTVGRSGKPVYWPSDDLAAYEIVELLFRGKSALALVRSRSDENIENESPLPSELYKIAYLTPNGVKFQPLPSSEGVPWAISENNGKIALRFAKNKKELSSVFLHDFNRMPFHGKINFGLNNKDYRDWETDRKSTRLNSSHSAKSRMPSSA